MRDYKEINPKELNESTFKLIGSDWMLITASKDDTVNTMTASWGGLGVLWNKNVAYIFIRPQRYTKEFVDASDKFSLTFFDESFKKDLSYLGTVSGRDEDKISKTKLNVRYIENIPVFQEAKLTILCRKLYAQDLDPNCFIDKSLADKCYPSKDYHTVYVAEIEKVLIK